MSVTIILFVNEPVLFENMRRVPTNWFEKRETDIRLGGTNTCLQRIQSPDSLGFKEQGLGFWSFTLAEHIGYSFSYFDRGNHGIQFFWAPVLEVFIEERMISNSSVIKLSLQSFSKQICRLSLYGNKTVAEYQGGFMAGRTNTNQIFTVKMMQTNSFEQNLGQNMLFFDCRHRYRCISGKDLKGMMERTRTAKKGIKLVKMILAGMSNKVISEGNLWD